MLRRIMRFLRVLPLFASLFLVPTTWAEDPILNPVVTLSEAAGGGKYIVALDEIVLRDGKTTKVETIPAQASVMALLSFAEELLTTGKMESMIVLYPADEQRNPSNRRVLTNDIMVKSASANPATIGAVAGVYQVAPSAIGPDYYKVTVLRPGSTLEVANRLEELPGVEKAEPQVTRRYKPRLTPNDPLFANQWNLLNTGQLNGLAGVDINVTGAWDNYTGAGVLIAIVDSGVDMTHPDLKENINVENSYNFIDDDPDAGPDQWRRPWDGLRRYRRGIDEQ